MEVSVNIVRELVNQLPIGLYAGRRIPCELSLDAETSYYDMVNDNIVISFPIVAKGLEKAPEATTDFTEEIAVRSMLYHELSHVILTPKFSPYIFEYIWMPSFEIFNIFEDERIETLLRNYYLDVNFKKQIFYICGKPSENPTSAEEAFFNIVRFRQNLYGLAGKVQKIIDKHSNINSSYRDDYYDNNGWRKYREAVEYLKDIKSLYDEVLKHFKSNSSATPSFNSDIKNGSECDSNGNEEEMEASAEALNKLLDDIGKNTADDETINEAIKATFNDRIDKKVYETLKATIMQFNHKNNSGNGINAYSGILNPRNVGREDYKYFDKKTGVNGNNKFGSLHLNLMLDDSGSYSNNCAPTNKIIQALIEIEKEYKNFTFDVYFVAERYRKAKTNKEKYIFADGGNNLRPILFDLVRKAQKPNTFNYNIVMFDGLAYNGVSEIKNFAAFNRKNLTIISDNSNEKGIVKYCPEANKIFINDKYPEKISEEVIKALGKAFR